MVYIILMTLFTTSFAACIGTIICACIHDHKTDMRIADINASIYKVSSQSSAFKISFTESSKK